MPVNTRLMIWGDSCCIISDVSAIAIRRPHSWRLSCFAWNTRGRLRHTTLDKLQILPASTFLDKFTIHGLFRTQRKYCISESYMKIRCTSSLRAILEWFYSTQNINFSFPLLKTIYIFKNLHISIGFWRAIKKFRRNGDRTARSMRRTLLTYIKRRA